MIKIRDFEQYPFVREEKSYSFQKRAIYRYSSFTKLFHLVTPNYGKQNTIMSVDEITALIRYHKMIQYKKSQNIYQAINRAWENWDEDWEWNGTYYSANSSNNIVDAPLHDVHKIYYRIGYYHGRIVWVYVEPDGKARYCKFIDINTPPDWCKGGWTNQRNIHPIFNNSTNQYI